MAALESGVNQFVSHEQHCKLMTRPPRMCCHDYGSDAESDSTSEQERARLANESCQTALCMPGMEVGSNLAQALYCERLTVQLRGGSPTPTPTPTPTPAPAPAPAPAEACGNETSAPPSVTWAPESPPASAKNQVYPHVTRIATPRPGNQASPAKGPAKAKWNSTIKCNWPPTSPPRIGGGSAPAPRRPATSPAEGRVKNVGVMTFPTVNASDLTKKVEALEFELDIHVGNERQLLTVNEKLRKRLEMCLRELNDAGMMHLQLDNLNDEMEKILMLLRHLSEKNSELGKEKALVQAKLEREAALSKYTAAKMLVERQMEDQFVELCDAECQTICSCQQVDTRKRRRERKRWLEEEMSLSNQQKSRSLSPTQFRRAER